MRRPWKRGGGETAGGGRWQSDERSGTPPPEERCTRSDGKDWRCRRRKLPGKSLCEAHYEQLQRKRSIQRPLVLYGRIGKKGGRRGSPPGKVRFVEKSKEEKRGGGAVGGEATKKGRKKGDELHKTLRRAAKTNSGGDIRLRERKSDRAPLVDEDSDEASLDSVESIPALKENISVSFFLDEDCDVNLPEGAEDTSMHQADPGVKQAHPSPSRVGVAALNSSGDESLVSLGTMEMSGEQSTSSFPTSTEVMEEGVPESSSRGETLEEITSFALQDNVLPGTASGKHESTLAFDFPAHGVAWPDDPQPVPLVGVEIMLDTLMSSARATFQRETLPSVEVVQDALRAGTRGYHALGLPRDPWMAAVENVWEEFRRLHESSASEAYHLEIQQLEAKIDILFGKAKDLESKAEEVRGRRDSFEVAVTESRNQATLLRGTVRLILQKIEEVQATLESNAKAAQQAQAEESSLIAERLEVQDAIAAKQTRIEDLMKRKSRHL